MFRSIITFIIATVVMPLVQIACLWQLNTLMHKLPVSPATGYVAMGFVALTIIAYVPIVILNIIYWLLLNNSKNLIKNIIYAFYLPVPLSIFSYIIFYLIGSSNFFFIAFGTQFLGLFVLSIVFAVGSNRQPIDIGEVTATPE